MSAIRQQLTEVFIKLKQVTRISRELKEMGPQADFVVEQQLSKIGQQLKELNISENAIGLERM